MKKTVKNKKTKIKSGGKAIVKKMSKAKKESLQKTVAKIEPETIKVDAEKEKLAPETVVKEEKDLLVLETLDHIPTDEENGVFYLGLAISTLMTIVFGWQRNFTAALVFVLLIVVIFMFLAKKPGRITLRLDREYFWLNEAKYNVFNLEYFWFTEQYGVKYLNIKIKKSIIPVLTIALQEANINNIRLAFLNFIPEISPEEIEDGVLENYKDQDKDKK